MTVSSRPVPPFKFAGATYRAPQLSAWDQFAALGIIDLTFEGMRQRTRTRRGRTVSTPDASTFLREAIDALGPEKLAALFDLCLFGVERQVDGAWVLVWDDETADTTFDDLNAGRTVALVLDRLRLSLLPYFSYVPLKIDEPSKGITYDGLQLPKGLSWLLRPVERNMCRFESLLNGTLDLAHVALLNDQIAVSLENDRRAHAAAVTDAQTRAAK